ncbi:MAG: hypothetical protein SV186_06565 [Candidatus Nanohaloarchaea archaeon]|nr:hypothetical protein [Candidatus Nanohaloarchaea archaeon]
MLADVKQRLDALASYHKIVVALSWLLGAVVFYLALSIEVGYRFVGSLAFMAYMAVPFLTARLDHDGRTTFQRAFCYAAVLPGLAVLGLWMGGVMSALTSLMLLFVTGLTGYWVWAGAVYASHATELYTSGAMTKQKLGYLFVPVFTGTPLGAVLIFIGVMEGMNLPLLAGTGLLVPSVYTLSILLRKA